ncbi:Crotonobetainyl-CoA:carnitine CoA-transferase CaiB [Sphingobium faniae]|nr:Crotonobetainyl-CoA:carnitine CoA-transferase CaiB [Sphingobium faniae]
MAGPLENLVVIEASRTMSGAIAGLLLADHGAEVVKLEPEGGDWLAHSPARRGWDRGKRSVELDIESEADLPRIRRLIGGADVLLLSLTPQEAARQGLDQESLARNNPGLIVCFLTAYGADTPFADRPYGESLAAARLGAMIEKGNPHRPDAPFYLGHPALQYGQAFLAVIDVLAALRARGVTGAGQSAEASLLDSFLAQSPMNWWWHETGMSYIARSEKPSTTGTPFGRTRLITGLFQCGDGEYLQVHSGGPGAFKALTDLLGFGDRIQAIEGAEMAVPLEDDEYQAVRVEIYDAFRQKSRAEWLSLFYAHDIATLPVLRPAEALLDDQVEAMGQRIVLPDAEHGEVQQAGPAIRFRHAAAQTLRPAPAIGADNDSLDPPSQRARRVVDGAGDRPLAHALDGIRILDLSSFFACGYAGRLMSDLGADVIKVETPGGDQMRPLADPFEACQRGKRGVVLNLKTERGLEIFRKLVESADVVMHNWRPGKADKAGIGYEALSAINPRLVYAYLPGYGSSGPKAKLKSFAPLISGFCGLLYEGAGEGNAPVPSVFGNEDYNNGFLGAVGVLMALYRRGITGKGDYLECPQVHSSLFTTSEHCLAADNSILWGLRLDKEQMGFSALDRLYRTADGWISVCCPDDRRFAALAAAMGDGELAADPRFASAPARQGHDRELADRLTPFFAGLSSAEAFARLDGAGAPCEIPVDKPWLIDFFHADWAMKSGRVFDYPQSIHGHVRQIGFLTHLSGTPGRRRGPAPRLGEHTAEILIELGYGPQDITALVADGAVKLAG